MTEPTPEAVAWRKRADKLRTEDVCTGAREICPECERPVSVGWDKIPACSCSQAEESRARWQAGGYGWPHHGLEGIETRDLVGTTTYG